MRVHLPAMRERTKELCTFFYVGRKFRTDVKECFLLPAVDPTIWKSEEPVLLGFGK